MLAVAARRVSSLSMPSTTKNLNIHWFRHQDLRLMDNPALNRSVQKQKTQSSNNNDISSGLLPIFCFDPRLIHGSTQTPFGSQKCGAGRAQFLIESVQDLRKQLQEKGSGLVVAVGKPEEVFPKLLSAIEQELDDVGLEPSLVCQEEVASEELAVDKALKNTLKTFRKGAKGSLETVWGSTLYDIDDLPFEQGLSGMPDVFTPFRNKMEKVKLFAKTPFLIHLTNFSIFYCSTSTQRHECRNAKLKDPSLFQPNQIYHFQRTLH